MVRPRATIHAASIAPSNRHFRPRIRITAADQDRLDQLTRDAPADAAHALREVFQHRAELWNWLAADPNHPAQFLNDPLDALSRAGIALTSEAHAALKALRAQNAGRAVVSPQTRLDRIDVTIEPRPAAPKRGSKRA